MGDTLSSCYLSGQTSDTGSLVCCQQASAALVVSYTPSAEPSRLRVVVSDLELLLIGIERSFQYPFCDGTLLGGRQRVTGMVGDGLSAYVIVGSTASSVLIQAILEDFASFCWDQTKLIQKGALEGSAITRLKVKYGQYAARPMR